MAQPQRLPCQKGLRAYPLVCAYQYLTQCLYIGLSSFLQSKKAAKPFGECTVPTLCLSQRRKQHASPIMSHPTLHMQCAQGKPPYSHSLPFLTLISNPPSLQIKRLGACPLSALRSPPPPPPACFLHALRCAPCKQKTTPAILFVLPSSTEATAGLKGKGRIRAIRAKRRRPAPLGKAKGRTDISPLACSIRPTERKEKGRNNHKNKEGYNYKEKWPFSLLSIVKPAPFALSRRNWKEEETSIARTSPLSLRLCFAISS